MFQQSSKALRSKSVPSALALSALVNKTLLSVACTFFNTLLPLRPPDSQQENALHSVDVGRSAVCFER